MGRYWLSGARDDTKELGTVSGSIFLLTTGMVVEEMATLNVANVCSFFPWLQFGCSARLHAGRLRSLPYYYYPIPYPVEDRKHRPSLHTLIRLGGSVFFDTPRPTSLARSSLLRTPYLTE